MRYITDGMFYTFGIQYHSYRSESTGLAKAALMVSMDVVNM